MKKLLSLMLLMAAFSFAGFSQSAADTSQKATMMGNGQVVNVKTGEVVREAKASTPIPANIIGQAQITRSGGSNVSNATTARNAVAQPNGLNSQVQVIAGGISTVEKGNATTARNASAQPIFKTPQVVTTFKPKTTARSTQ